MTDPTVIHDTFVIERRYAVPPARVFAAFADAAKKRRWYAESGHHAVEAFEMDFRVGGAELARYRFRPGGPFGDLELGHDGVYLDIIPDARIVMASTMAMEGRRISAALISFTFTGDGAQTVMTCTHQAAFFEGSDGPELRHGGWVQLLDKIGDVL